MKSGLVIFCLLQALAFGDETETSFKFDQEQVEAYHKSSFGQLEEMQKVLESPFFVGAERVLDLGCGDGKMTALLAKKLPQTFIVGCDISKSMIEFASKRYSPEKYPNLKFVEKNAMDLLFHNEFDRIISFNCLHWMRDQQKALKEISASLKPGGKALLISAPRCRQDDLQTICAQLMTSPKWGPLFKNYQSIHSFHTEEEYQKMSAEVHLSVGKMQQIIRDVIFEDRPSLETLLTAVLTPLSHLPESNRAGFVQEVFALLKEKGRIDGDGKIHLHVAQLQLLVVKPLE